MRAGRFAGRQAVRIAATLGAACVLILAVAASHSAPGTTSPWWASGTPPTTCAWPAVYRTATVTRGGLGGCAGVLLDPPAQVRLRAGEELDLHMTTGASQGSLPPAPEYPLPSSPDAAVLWLVSVTDEGATGVYRAVAPGTAVLTSSGFCIHSSGQETEGECPLLAVTVAAPPALGSPTPTPSPSGFTSGPIGPLTVTHPATWHVVAGPPAAQGWGTTDERHDERDASVRERWADVDRWAGGWPSTSGAASAGQSRAKTERKAPSGGSALDR